MTYDLLTGATGFLGSYLLRDALRDGRPVAVLARSSRTETAQERVRRILDELDVHGTQPVVIEGDLRRPGLGLDPSAVAWIEEHCGRVIHSAASLSFLYEEGEPYITNVDGMRFLLELTRAVGITEFHLISTAFVSGSRPGRVLESDLESGQQFVNDYERSKYMAETLLRQADFLERWAVYRPSVIVGDSQTGFTSSGDNFYAFLRLAGHLVGNTTDDVLAGLGVRADDRCNMVPVDWVSNVINHLIKSAPANRTTYHLTNPDPARLGLLLAAARSIAPTVSTLPQKAVDGVVGLYRPYLAHPSVFDTANVERAAPHLPCPVLDEPTLDRLVRFAASDRPRRITPPGAHPEFALAVPGEEHRWLDLANPTSSVQIVPPELNLTRVRVFCNASTLDRMRDGLGVEQALLSGLVAMEGDATGFQTASELLGAYAITMGRAELTLGEVR